MRLLHFLPDNTNRRRAAHRDEGAVPPRYIKTERKALFAELLSSSRLNTYLAVINEQATEQMLWVQQMNNIRDRAMEIVNHDLIYA